jgi:hypothetical protein
MKSTKVASIDRTVLMNAGVNIASIPETQPDIVLGFRAARNPQLVECRKTRNEVRISQLTAMLLAEYDIQA